MLCSSGFELYSRWVPLCLRRVERLKIVSGTNVDLCHITPVLHQLHWLPVSFRINFKILLLTFKAIHELALSYINDLVRINSLNSRDKLRSNDGILLSHPNFKTSTTLGDRAFVASALKLWNDLLLEIRWSNLLTLLQNV